MPDNRCMKDTHNHNHGALRDKEYRDIRKEKLAEDTAYTINHAVACGTLDMIGGSPLGSYLFERFGLPVGCGHSFTEWVKGELTGDLLAIFPTIATQRYAPWVMDGISAITEPTLGWAYRAGAERSARKWAHAHGISTESDAYKERVEALYRHEVDHLPHAVLWTGYSIPITAGTLQLMPGNHHHGHHHHHGSHCSHGHHGGHGHGSHGHHHAHNFRHMMMATVAGKVFSGTLLLSARAMAPDSARRWDHWASNTIYSPLTKTIGNLFGVDDETLKRVSDKHQKLFEAQPDHVVSDVEAHDKLAQADASKAMA